MNHNRIFRFIFTLLPVAARRMKTVTTSSSSFNSIIASSLSFKSENQANYVKHLRNPDVKLLVTIGPAGTGKTFFACHEAIRQLKAGNVSRIIVTRPVVPVEEEEIGYLPGSMNKKMDPWLRPLFDIFEQHFSKMEMDRMLSNNVLEISPLGFMRGRTFKHAFVIADEMQNSSPSQMLMLATRLGEQSRMVVTGDLMQTDLAKPSGLFDFVTKFARFKKRHDNVTGIEVVRMGSEDIQRSAVVAQILDMYNHDEDKDKKPPTPLSSAPSITPSVSSTRSFSPQKNITLSTNVTIISNSNSTSPKKRLTPSNSDAAMIPREWSAMENGIFYC